MKSNNNLSGAYVTIRLSPDTNKLLAEAAKRSNRKKLQEALLRLEDHLYRFRSIAEINYVKERDLDDKKE